MSKHHNYFNRLFLNYSSALLAALTILFLIMLCFTYREQYLRNVEIQEQLVSKTQSQLDSSLISMDRIINGLLFNKSFMNIIRDPEAALYTPEYNKQVLNFFVTMDAPNFSTYRIIAFNDDVYYTLTKSEENPSFIRKASVSYPWKDQFLESGGEKVFLPVHVDSFDENGVPVYSVGRLITDGRDSYGIIEVQNEYDILSSICTLAGNSGEILLFNGEGTLLFPGPTDESRPSEDTVLPLYEKVDRTPGHSGSQLLGSQQLSYATSAYSGWTVVLYCPAWNLVPYGLEMIALSISAFLLLAVMSLILFRVLTRRMAAPLTDLNNSLKKVSLENMNLEIPQSYNIEEIENINRSFQTMFSQLQEAIAVNVQSRANEERANYLALQSQMNPHTIYNTISMIESVSYMHGDREVSGLCVCFSQMLRYISDYTKDSYTVRDELQHLDNYAALIQKRYEGRLDIQVQAHESLLSEAIPKFTIQPLVENSVKHGIRSGSHKLSVSVTLDGTSQSFELRVEDNGAGFSDTALTDIGRQLKLCDESLKDGKDVINRKIGNLALSNIYIRCRILYGKSFRFSYGNLPGGSGAFISIQVHKEET